ncbi:LysR family transcriptional regulator [Celerinatantimonas yamalensis]|uniref:LysR family transcriptional regulator n=1 Tax=Celerinatantimonas yamalensis TaxID=559956 RepID=A0ABW9G2A3_9GAMM
MIHPKLIALLPDLASFIIVVEEKSFTGAANQLGVTPSALSKLITRLEHALAVKLFERSTRKLVITQAGEKIYDQCLVMVNAAKQAVELSRRDHDELAGALTIAAPEAFLYSVLQPFVWPFLQQHPNIEIKLRAADGNIDLLSNNIDLAFRLTDKPDENLVLKELCKTNLVLCASPNYIAQRGMPNHPTQLTQHDCLYLAENSNDYRWQFVKNEEIHTVAITGRYAVNHSQMRLNGVKHDLGIGIFHDFVVQDSLAANEVVQVLPEWMIKSNYHGAVAMQYPQTQHMPARLRAFIDYVLRYVQPKLLGAASH